MANYAHVRIGHGKQVHYAHVDAEDRISRFPICGSGRCSTGSKRFYGSRKTNDPVTCEKCLEQIKIAPEPNRYYPRKGRLYTITTRSDGRTYVSHLVLAQWDDGLYWSRADVVRLILIPTDLPRGFWNRCTPGIDWTVGKEAGPELTIYPDFTFRIESCADVNDKDEE